MSDMFVQVAPDSTGAKIDTTQLVIGSNTVERQRVQIGGSKVGDNFLVEPDATGSLPVSLDDDDVFGTIVTSSRTNQVEASFVGAGPLSNYLGLSYTGTGASSMGSGLATISTGTGTTSSALGTSNSYVTYRPGFEIYNYFTAGFTTPTSASSFQRIGIFDSNDGFYLGFEGTTFCVSKRSGGTDTILANTSNFNGDLLSGAVNSKFTRGEFPEAINFNYHNVYRIRFGWLGSAPIIFEVLSPDGYWVAFHTVLQPNTASVPSIQNPGLVLTAIVSKTSSDATNLILSTSCWAAGTTGSSSASFPQGSLTINQIGTLIQGAVTVNAPSYTTSQTSPLSLDIFGNLRVKNNAGYASTKNSTTTPLTSNATFTGTGEDTLDYASIQVQALTDQTGTIQFQFSIDGTNWDDTAEIRPLTANSLFSITEQASGRYFRLIIMNGSVAQTFIRVGTLLKNESASGDVLDLGTPVSLGSDGLATHSVISGPTTLGVGSANGQAFNQVRVNTAGSLQVGFGNASQDIFGQIISGGRYNQVEVPFMGSVLPSNVTTSSSGGGTVTNTGGSASFTSSTGGTSSAIGTSIGNTTYRSGHEVFAMFTAAWTIPTSVNSYQRIGLYDANNGFRIGYEGTTFAITVRSNAVDVTSIARTSFNGDLLNGSINSKFTRMGIPEAVNLTFHNVYRIRFGWLGSAPVLFEVLSPDGEWIVFHTIKQPNTSASPSIAIPNLPIKLEVVKTSADATNLTMSTSCWAAGTTSTQSVPTYDLTTAALGIGASYVTQPFDTTLNGSFLAYTLFSITPGQIFLDISSDTITWTTIFTDSNIVGVSYSYDSCVQSRYARFRFVNGYVTNSGGQNNLYQTVAQSDVGARSTISIADQAGTVADITPYNSLRVSTESGGLFFDDFDVFDTTIKWNVATVAGTATVSAANSALALAIGTTSANSAIVSSQTSFIPSGGGYLDTVHIIQFEAASATNCRRYWGRGTVTGTAPNNFVGFELTGAGVLQAVVYTAGALSFSFVVSRPTDGLYHTYKTQIRPDVMYFYFDSEDTPLYTVKSHIALPGTEPLLMVGVNSGIATATPVYNVMAIWVGDTSKTSSQLSDGTNPYIKVSVSPKGIQGANAIATQDLKDSGRTAIVLYANSAASGTTGTETAITLTKSAGTAATSAAVSFVITSGKTFRITSITLGSRGNATATAQLTTFNLRINTAGAVVVTTTPIVISATTATSATALAWDRYSVPLPDGLEYAGNGTIQFGLTANSVYTTNAPTWFATITGFEY